MRGKTPTTPAKITKKPAVDPVAEVQPASGKSVIDCRSGTTPL
jgi:hypothetical protein